MQRVDTWMYYLKTPLYILTFGLSSGGYTYRKEATTESVCACIYGNLIGMDQF
jgi:hypothetical protein